MKYLVTFLLLFVFSGQVFSQGQTIPEGKSSPKMKVSERITESNEIRANFNATESIVFSDNFDSYANGSLTFGNWVLVDVDGGLIGGINGFTFPHSGEAIAWTVVDWSSSTTIAAHSGTNTVATMYNDPVVGNNDWLISPAIPLTALTNAYLSFWTQILSTAYGPEYISVYVSTNPNAVTPADFPVDPVQAYTLNTASTWVEQVISLDQFVGNTVRIAIRYHSTDVFTVLVDDFTVGSLIGPGMASNPTPSDGAVGLPLSGNNLTWANPSAATTLSVYFSSDETKVQNMDPSALLYSGAVVTTQSLASVEPLLYSTSYYWKIVETGPTGSTEGLVWSFRTMRDPATFFEDFTAGAGAWTITNEAGATCQWTIFTPPWPNSYMGLLDGAVLSADTDECGSGSSANTTATLNTGLNFSAFSKVFLEFDSDFRGFSTSADMCYVDISVDGGTVWTNVLTYQNTSNTRITEHVLIDISPLAAGQANVKVRFHSVQPGWDYFWAIDNITMYGTDPIPVELASFVANVTNNTVVLEWQTATETNNKGFEIQKKSQNGDFMTIGFMGGAGTITQAQNYSYTDSKVAAGNYTYRLKQIDFDGSFEYSKNVEVSVTNPLAFSLEQNYPNPFNPTTNIRFNLAADSRVSLKVFDILGQEITTLVNGLMTSGSHTVQFNGKSLQSGIYLVKMEASGTDGKNFSSVKKMILNK